MYKAFIVGAKLIGMLQIYWGISFLSSISLFAVRTTRMEPPGVGGVVIQVVGILGYALFVLGVAWILIFRTEWVARKVKLSKDSAEICLNGSNIMCIGISLIGLYIVAHSIPDVFKSIAGWITSIMQYSSMRHAMAPSAYRMSVASGLWTQVMPSLLKLGLGLFIVAKTDTIQRLLCRNRERQNQALDRTSG